MSRLDELIAEYCPNGVEYKELQEILRLKTRCKIAGKRGKMRFGQRKTRKGKMLKKPVKSRFFGVF